MTMYKIKINDMVEVIAGRDKGRSGRVLKYAGGNRLLVEGVNLVKRHTKPNPQKNQQGGILDRESPIHISNVKIINMVTNKPDRIGFKFLEDGRKVRYFKSTGEMVEV
jgi:large subunit ribosomal protein L24